LFLEVEVDEVVLKWMILERGIFGEGMKDKD
jgi:hypothetical protein